MESTLQFDMMDDLLQFLTPAPRRPTGLDFEGTSGKVLLSPAGNWWMGDESPREELQQDSMWCDPLDGSLTSPMGQYGLDVQYQDDLSSSPQHGLWLNDDDEDALLSQYKLISHSDLCDPSPLGQPTLSPQGPHTLSPLGHPALSPHGPRTLSPLASSPMDVKFELGMLDQSLLDQSACYVDVGSAMEAVELSLEAVKPVFTLGGYDDFTSVECLDSTVPSSPIEDSSLVDLDVGDDDSLHEAEIVCQLLREIDSLGRDGLHDASTTLLHVSPEEVESVLSRDSSFENLAALDEPSVSHIAVAPVSRPAALPTMISSFISSPVTTLPFTLGTGYQQGGLVGKISAPLASIASQPYGKADVLIERRQRKKEQNKTAALRYRQKKREEKGHTTTEVDELEQKNAALRSRADELTKEINYLRGLLEEIRRQ